MPPHHHRPRRPHAVIIVRDGPGAVDRAAECTSYCRRRGYHLTGVVVGTRPEQWAEVLRMARGGQVQVVVTPSSTVRPDYGVELESITQDLPDEPAGRAAPHVAPHRTRRRPRFLR